MKFQVTLKDPDSFYDAIRKAVEDQVSEIDDLDDEERDDIVETRREKVEEQLEKWVRFGELITIEFDLDAGTATVLEDE